MARPRAPLWLDMATLPLGGKTEENVACMRTFASVLITPMQFGPTMRMPAARTFSRMRSSASRPAAPVSPKPAVIDAQQVAVQVEVRLDLGDQIAVPRRGAGVGVRRRVVAGIAGVDGVPAVVGPRRAEAGLHHFGESE